jgi:hypothetical protein
MADIENLAQRCDRELLPHCIEELEPHWLSTLTKSCGPVEDLPLLVGY